MPPRAKPDLEICLKAPVHCASHPGRCTGGPAQGLHIYNYNVPSSHVPMQQCLVSRLCDGVANRPHRFLAHSLSLSRDYLSSQICNLDFVEEASQRFTIFGILGVQKLDGDSSTDAGHMAFTDDAHAPLTELPHDLIPTKRGSHHSRSPLYGTQTLLFHEPLQTHSFACRRWPVQVCHNV